MGLRLKDKLELKMFKEQESKKKYSKEFWKCKFKEVMATKYHGYCAIFTDGSKQEAGTSAATYDATDEEVQANKINENFSITNAELLAILQGACQTLLNDELRSVNYLAGEIAKELGEATLCDIRIQWIPSHQEIKGNERADQEAVKAAQGKQTMFNALTLGDAKVLAEKEVWGAWKRKYQEVSKDKGAVHFQYMTNPGKKIWCYKLNLNTEEKRILNRIRAGHTMTKERRFGWGWEPNDQCDDCGVKENLHHLLYDCPKFNTLRAEYHLLEQMTPLNNILKQNIETELKQITEFVKRTKLQI